MSQSLVEEPQIQRSLVCSRDFFPKKLPLTSGFIKKQAMPRKWLHSAGLMIWSLIRRITIQHNNEPRQCRTQRDSFSSTSCLQWETWASGTAQREVSSRLHFGPVVTLIQHVLAILIFSTLRLSNGLCTRYALNLNGSYRHISFYDNKVHGYHRNEVVYLSEVGVSKVTGLCWNTNTGPRMSFLVYCRKK